MESRPVRDRPRERSAAERPRDRGSASVPARRLPERHRGSRHDTRRAGDPERHPRCDRSPLSVLAGHPGHDQGSALVTTMNVTINGKAYGPFEVRDELSTNDFLREYLGLTGTKRDKPHLRRARCEFLRKVDPYGRGARGGRATFDPAKGLRGAFFVPMRLLHPWVPERGAGAARAVGKKARGAGRSG